MPVHWLGIRTKIIFMKLFLNKHTLKENDLNYYTEIFLCVPFLTQDIYFNKLLPILGKHNESLFTKLFYTGQNFITAVNQIEESFVSVLPFKYNFNDPRVYEICENSKKNNKTVIAFYNDDNFNSLKLPENLILFRTSILNSQKHKNERAFPCLIPDHFCKNYNCYNSISFCGAITSLIRSNVLNKIKHFNLNTNFIFRNQFWGHDINIKTRLEYNNNMLNSKYALCIKGAGNFSFRFYEALSFGRVPILIDTDNTLPFSNIIDWEKYIIRIKEDEIEYLPKLINEDTRNMEDNRKLWEEYFSVEGYAKNFIKDI